MSRTSKAFIAGAFEHPIRKAIDKTIPQLHAEVALGALQDAGLTNRDVDGYISVPATRRGLAASRWPNTWVWT